MHESQVHQAFSKWLDRLEIPYVHSRTDKRTSTKCGDPDYFVFWCSRVVAIEIKVGRNKLSLAQEKRIAFIRRSGNKVVICRSCEECIEAVRNILCDGKLGDLLEPRNGRPEFREEFSRLKRAVRGDWTYDDHGHKHYEENVAAVPDGGINNLLPVPVLAEPESSTRPSDRNRRVGGEARESTNTKLERPVEQVASGTRGGQQNLYIATWKGVPWVCQRSAVGPDLLLHLAHPIDIETLTADPEILSFEARRN